MSKPDAGSKPGNTSAADRAMMAQGRAALGEGRLAEEVAGYIRSGLAPCRRQADRRKHDHGGIPRWIDFHLAMAIGPNRRTSHRRTA